MVRLKVSHLVVRVTQRVFQFHYGTIKRIEDALKDAREELFQFHYGTIKSRIQSGFTHTLNYFNSTMVRLKVT